MLCPGCSGIVPTCGEGVYGFAPPNESLLGVGADVLSMWKGGDVPPFMKLTGLVLLDLRTIPALGGVN